ncbi:hypothetical protein BD310DRAFT_934684 [Dichomitus squalens]|uniref:MYND-type domain-containing protein n=1 Tax=Dichomitus squalens TaxID=114155 RepID=A0A4Q9PLE4_9APHY|nr:hypothetical protein BD310DRAFT_934684 [Dichomitus squalens]
MKYCSRDCQKASWPTHKPMCRSQDANPMRSAITPAEVGHSTGISLARAVNRWSKMHDYTCDIIAHVEMMLDGNWSLPASGERVLLFGLVSRTPSDPDGSPSAEFTVDVHYIATRREYVTHGIYIVASQWEPNAVRSRQELEASLRAKLESVEGTPKLAGILPKTTYLVGTGMVTGGSCRVYFPTGYQPGAPVDLVTKVWLKLLLNICLETINMGLVLRPRDLRDRSSTLPLIGKYVQHKKKWRWQSAEEWAWKALAKVMLEKYLCVYTPSDIFATYHKLWQYGMPGNPAPAEEMD